MSGNGSRSAATSVPSSRPRWRQRLSMIPRISVRNCEMAGPLSHLRRSPLRRTLEAESAEWRDLADAAVPDRIPSGADPRRLAIIDLSPLPRLGIKGRETITALAKRGITLEPTPNRAFPQPNGGLAL